MAGRGKGRHSAAFHRALVLESKVEPAPSKYFVTGASRWLMFRFAKRRQKTLALAPPSHYVGAVNRRKFLRQAGLTGASLAAAAPFSLLTGCAARRGVPSSANSVYAAPDISFVGGGCGLPPGHVSADREA